jgi:hypothetical protein
LFSVNEIVGRSGVDLLQIYARGGVPDADKLLRMRIRKRFEQHAFQNTKDHRIGSHPGSQRNHGYRCEHRRAPQAPQHLLELVSQQFHRVSRPATRRAAEGTPPRLYGFIGENDA